MADTVDRRTRSRMMAAIRGKDTEPERIVRSYLHRAGFRFRLHDRRLPGRPDIVLAKYRTVVQVHGCFWHRHPGCRFAYEPASNRPFWMKKFRGNVVRDRKTARALRSLGWHIETVWECRAQSAARLDQLVTRIRARAPQ